MEILNNKVLIKPDKAKDVTDGGIAIPETAREKPRSGIIKLCEDKSFIDKRVHYPSYSGIEIELDKEIFHIVSFKELWLIEK